MTNYNPDNNKYTDGHGNKNIYTQKTPERRCPPGQIQPNFCELCQITEPNTNNLNHTSEMQNRERSPGQNFPGAHELCQINELNFNNLEYANVGK